MANTINTKLIKPTDTVERKYSIFVILSILTISTLIFSILITFQISSKASLTNISYCLQFFFYNIHNSTNNNGKEKNIYNANNLSDLFLTEDIKSNHGLEGIQKKCLQDYYFFFLEKSTDNIQLIKSFNSQSITIKTRILYFLHYIKSLYIRVFSNVLINILYKEVKIDAIFIPKNKFISSIIYDPISTFISLDKCLISNTHSNNLLILCSNSMNKFQHLYYYVLLASSLYIIYLIHITYTKTVNQRTSKPKGHSSSIAILTHELRTPISIIISLADILENSIANYQQKTLFDTNNDTINKKESNYVGDIKSQGMQMLHLVDSMLALEQIYIGNIKINRSNINIVEIIERVIISFFNEISEKNILIIREYEDVNVFADKKKLYQCFEHVLSNAIKFNKHCGEILIKIFLSLENKVIVKFRDSGIGIADLRRVFECFYQIDSGLNRKFNGTGVGLFVVKHLSDLQNIEVFINSEENVFTEVIFQFPKTD